VYTKLSLETLKEGDHTEGLDVGVRIILSLKEWDMRVVT
jgi:hypothetical protein